MILYEKGYTITEIAKTCGISKGAMSKWFKKHDYLLVEKPKRGRKKIYRKEDSNV
jgi:DNA-binding transcriptional regulator GbsR (MarR family)